MAYLRRRVLVFRHQQQEQSEAGLAIFIDLHHQRGDIRNVAGAIAEAGIDGGLPIGVWGQGPRLLGIIRFPSRILKVGPVGDLQLDHATLYAAWLAQRTVKERMFFARWVILAIEQQGLVIWCSQFELNVIGVAEGEDVET